MARTARLPGVEDEIPELVIAAENYVTARDGRMAMLKRETELKQILLDLMMSHKKTSYHDDEANLTITVENSFNVKVKVGKDDDDDE